LSVYSFGENERVPAIRVTRALRSAVEQGRKLGLGLALIALETGNDDTMFDAMDSMVKPRPIALRRPLRHDFYQRVLSVELLRIGTESHKNVPAGRIVHLSL
jgi:hypothetical protein